MHREHFREYLQQGVAAERLSPDLLKFDLDQLADALDLERISSLPTWESRRSMIATSSTSAAPALNTAVFLHARVHGFGG